MKRARRLVAALLLAGLSCGPESGSGSTDADPQGSSSSDASACAPSVAGVELALQLGPGEAGLPEDGDPVRVVADADGNAIIAVTDRSSTVDVVIARISADGTMEWSERYDGIGLDDTVLDVAVADDGGVYVAILEQYFELEEGVRGYGVALLALGADGTRRWRYVGTDGNPSQRLAAVAVNTDGHVALLVGNHFGPVTGLVFTMLDGDGRELARSEIVEERGGLSTLDAAIASSGDVLLTATPFPELWHARLSRSGTLLQSELSASIDGRATAIEAGLDDDAYVLVATGDSESGDAGLSLLHLAANGMTSVHYSHAWPTGSGYAAALALDCTGTPIIAGDIQHRDRTEVADRQAWLAAIAPDGRELWSRTLSGPAPIVPRSLAITDAGTFWLGGLGGRELGPWLARVGVD